jgi:hypothetical protein
LNSRLLIVRYSQSRIPAASPLGLLPLIAVMLPGPLNPLA